MFGIIGDVSDYTPKGILTNIGTKVVERVSPGTLKAVGGNIEEVKTRVGVTVDVVVTNDNAATVRRDFDTKPDSENKFEVSGGKGVSSVAAAALLGSIARKLPGKGDGADVTPSGQPVKIIVAEDRFPESAQHIRDAQQAGKPNVLTIDRAGARDNRRASLRGKPTEPAKDRDEFPPAFTKEGGESASVRNIGSSDNRGSGACIGQQCRGLPNGS